MNFQNKTVLITGGSRGIGQATAKAFAAAGARVAINFRKNNRAARTTVESLEGSGHFAVKADIGDPEEVENLVEAVIDEFGRLDILVNNAGIHDLHPIDEVNYEEWQEEWRKTLNVNLLAPANLCWQVAQHMIEQGGGHIVNVSSRGAFRGEPDQPAYGASKAALNALSQSLAQALGKYNIAVNAVAPGFVQTDMTAHRLEGEEGEGIKLQSPFQRVAEPEEVANAILFLASGKIHLDDGRDIGFEWCVVFSLRLIEYEKCNSSNSCPLIYK